VANEIEKRIKEKLGVGPRLDADATASGLTPPSHGTGGPVGNGAGVPRNITTPPGVTV
jgi:recombination protein RecA